MINLLKADFYRIKKNKSFQICFLVSFVCIGLLAFILNGIAQENLGQELSSASTLLVDAMMGSLLASLVIGSYVCGDFESKTIHDEIACGEGRLSVVITKMISCMIVVAIIILPYAIVSLVCFFAEIEMAPLAGIPSVFVNIMCNATGAEVTGSTIGKSIVLCIVALIVYMARLSLCVPLAFKMRMPVVVMSFGIVTSFGFDILSQAVKDIPVISTIAENTPFSLIYELTMDASVGTILKVLLISVLFIVLVTWFTYILFRKTDIK